MLIFVSSSVMAEWYRVGATEEGVAYADSDTIRKSGNNVKMWVLTDFISPREQSLSGKAQIEYDCKEEQTRVLYVAGYSKNMGRGKVIGSGAIQERNWKPIVPGSIEVSMWKFACEK